MPAKKSNRSMSDAHKKALAEGRELGRAVRDYLEALESARPGPGRKASPETIRKKIDAVNDKLLGADPVQRVSLIQQRIDLEARLESLENAPDMAALEAAFIKAAKRYSENKGLSYAAWREAGVPASVLSAAGISRSS